MSDKRPVVHRIDDDRRVIALPETIRAEVAPHQWANDLPPGDSVRRMYEALIVLAERLAAPGIYRPVHEVPDDRYREVVALLPRKPLSTQHVSAAFVQENSEEDS